MYTSAFDAAGRMTTCGRMTASGMPANESVTYVHDNTGQLTRLTRNGVPTTYGYDATSNRNYAGYGVGANNRITTDGAYSYTYDNEGEILQKTLIANPAVATFYAYDHRSFPARSELSPRPASEAVFSGVYECASAAPFWLAGFHWRYRSRFPATQTRS